MMSTKLSDFTEDQQKIMLRAVMKEQRELEEHVASIRKYESIATLLGDSIRDFENQIEELNLIATKVAEALVTTQTEKIIQSN